MIDVPQFQLLGSLVWHQVKGAIRTMEPYQPAIAAGFILGKIGWQVYKRRSLKREITQLNKEIAWLSKILNSRNLNDAVAEQVGLRKDEFIASRREKKRQKNFTTLAFSQIPSLFFDHPGSNLYQSFHQIASRGLQMRYDARPVRAAAHPTFGSRIRRVASVSGSLLSMAGTLASIARMTKIISKDSPWGHLFTGLAIGVHAFEGALIGIRTLKSIYQNIKLGRTAPMKSTSS